MLDMKIILKNIVGSRINFQLLVNRFLLTFATFVCVSGTLFAQNTNVEMGREDKGKPLPSNRIVSGKFIDGVWSAYEGFQLKKSPIINSEPSGYKALQYMEHFDVSYVYQGEDQIYYLLSRGIGKEFKNLGWLPEKFTCIYQGQQTANNIYKKALIVNSLDQITKQRKVEPIPVRLAPTLQAPVIDPLRLYNIYSVYSDTNPKDPTKGFCLLGSDYGFPPDDNSKTNPKIPSETVKGWVSKENLLFWDTREGLEWDVKSTKESLGELRRTTPGKIFDSRKNAIKDAIGENVKPLLVEKFDIKNESIPLQHYSSRFPIIPLNNEEQIFIPEFGRLFKIAIFLTFEDAQKYIGNGDLYLKESLAFNLNTINSQILMYGWVWEKAKSSKASCNQVRIKMLTEEYDRLLLARLLEDIENANPGRKPSPENIAKILNNAGTGEKDKEIKTDNLSDHRLKSNGLFARSPLLSKPFGDLKDDEAFQSELNKLFMKRRLLEDIGKNEKSEFVQGFETLGDGTKIPVIKRIGEPKKEPRMFRPYGSTILTMKWVWLDFEDEWP
jgi:hypothetical protein